MSSRDLKNKPLVEASSEITFMPIYISVIKGEEYDLIIDPRLTLIIKRDVDSPGLLNVTDNSLGIDATSYSRDELIHILEEQIFFLWETYALEKPDNLTPRAQQLRNRLLRRIRSAKNAA